jgi:hypothetical protein
MENEILECVSKFIYMGIMQEVCRLSTFYFFFFLLTPIYSVESENYVANTQALKLPMPTKKLRALLCVYLYLASLFKIIERE